jgi:biofilm PGA synthesis N-glycosyltransferase PgaC
MTQPYVLITPARNEEKYIVKTLESVTAQIEKPLRWVIINDGSTDSTGEIARQYSVKYPFIQVVDRRADCDRNFSSKAHAIELGLRHILDLQYAFIGILDADVSFDSNYYKKVLTKFRENKKLGIAGGVIFTIKKNTKILSTKDLNHVAGAVQTFRTQCFRDIGGYIAIPIGGIDKIAEIMARMKGWQTTSFTDIEVLHYQKAGTKANNSYTALYRSGVRDSLTGYNLLYFIIRSFYRIFRSPYLIGAVLELVGFFSPMLFGTKRPVPKEFVVFLRKEQKKRLFALLKKNVLGLE